MSTGFLFLGGDPIKYTHQKNMAMEHPHYSSPFFVDVNFSRTIAGWLICCGATFFISYDWMI